MHFPAPALSRFAIFVAAVILIAIGVGAYITSCYEASIPVASFITGNRHAVLGLAAGVLTAVLAMWLAPSNTRLFVRASSWTAVGAFVADVAVTGGSTAVPLADPLAILHAGFAPVIFACVVAIAVFMLPELIWSPEPIDVGTRPLLRWLAMLAPVVVLLQIFLGAMYRHKVTGVMPHMGGAMIVALVLLILCIQVLQQFPAHASLKPMAMTAMGVLLAQILLGIVAFVMKLLDFDNSIGFVFLTIGHVVTGSLVLAASLVLAIEFRRCLPEAE